MRIVPIVEGHGEVEALPVLIRRFAQMTSQPSVEVARPIRVRRDKLLKPGELERAVAFAATKAGPDGRILILVDADEDCPARLGPELLQRAMKARPDRLSRVVLAKCEFESWFLASAESLRGKRSLALDLTSPEDPESVRGAKEWLGQRMAGGGGYRETVDQAPLAAAFDLELARKAPSFEKCYRELVALLSDR